MSTTRVPFDVAGTFVVASEQLVVAGKRFRRGDAFDWKAIGIDEQSLGLLWIAFKVDVSLGAAVSKPATTPLVTSPVPAKRHRR